MESAVPTVPDATGTVSGVAGFSEDAASLYLRPGDVIEAGAWRGGASLLARATLDSLGAPHGDVKDVGP